MPFYKKPHRDTIIANSSATLADLDVSDGTLTVDEVNSRVGIGTTSPSAALGVNGNVVVEPGGKLGIGLTAPDCPLDINAANDLPQAIIRYGTSYKTDLLTTSNGTFRITPTARTLQVDTGDTNGGNIQFTKAGGTVSGAISWDTGDKDVTLYSDANLYLGAGGSAADLTLNANGNAQFGGTVTATGITIGSTAITATGAELNYCDGVTSNIQTQLDSKGATAGSANITTVGTIGTGTWQGTAIASAYLDADTAHLSGTQTFSGAKSFTGGVTIDDGELTLGSTAITATGAELNHCDGVTSNIQTQLDSKGPTAGSGSITTVGTIGSGTWQGTAIASAYLDADTAHLSGTQTFTGAKTFSEDVIISGTTPKLTIGDGDAEDTMLAFDGNAADYRIGVQDSTDTLQIGKGLSHGTTAVIKIDSSTNCQVMHNSAVADGEYSGDLAMYTAGEDLSAGEVVYFKSDGKVYKAVATASATSRAVAMCVADVSANGMGAFLLRGFVRFNSNFPTYTVGGVVYTPTAEQSNLNTPHQTAPSADGQFLQIIGYAIGADSLWMHFDSTIVEIA